MFVDRDAADVLDVVSASRPALHRRPARRALRDPGHETAPGVRVLAVIAVDGVNIVTGQTAAWNQDGYVLRPWASHEIAGWRKSTQEVAAFELAALPDSYAALTGRPKQTWA